MATVQAHHERRRFSRITFNRAATFRAGDLVAPVSVLDVSLRGALLEVPAELEAEPGTACTVIIHLDAGEATIHFEGEIAHRNGLRVGVRCTAIDLESIAHLRRVVELALADDFLLDRELATLVSAEG